MFVKMTDKQTDRQIEGQREERYKKEIDFQIS
jgi:hypothetical protein